MDAYINGNKIKLDSGRKELTSSYNLDYVTDDGEYLIKDSQPKNSPGIYGILTVQMVDYNNIYQYFINYNGYYMRAVHADHSLTYEWKQLEKF